MPSLEIMIRLVFLYFPRSYHTSPFSFYFIKIPEELLKKSLPLIVILKCFLKSRLPFSSSSSQILRAML